MVHLTAALLVASASTAAVLASTNLRQQQFKPCSKDEDCNDGFMCLPTYDGTFAMCQPGARPPTRNYQCTDNADFYGDDLSNSHKGLVGCLYDCRVNPACTALSWVQDPSGQQGACYLKQLGDHTAAPTPKTGVKACKFPGATLTPPTRPPRACTLDGDCAPNEFCRPYNDGTAAACVVGARPTDRVFTCADHVDLYGDDNSHAHIGFFVCLFNCHSSTSKDCNAITWVPDADGKLGTCYYKQLKDPARAPTADARPLKTCKEVYVPPTPTTAWVASPGFQFKGKTLTTKSNVATLEDCYALCTATPGCAAVSYIKYGQSCALQTVADNYFPVWSKAVPLGAVAAATHNYKSCYANYDSQYNGDVFNFQGSFQDCAKCMADGKANAFSWWMGPADPMAQPINAQGTCYCKKLTSPVPPPSTPYPNMYGGTIFCQN